ncbi:hypothetical protein HDU99_005344, partial [Rhizoclosmatium hyalinum]
MSEAVEATTEITDTASPILNITSSTTPAEPSDVMVVDPPSTDTLAVPVVQQITSSAQPSASISTPIVSIPDPALVPATPALIPIEFDYEKSIYTLKNETKFSWGALASSSSAYGPPTIDSFPTQPDEHEGFVPVSYLFQDRLVAKDYSKWDEYGRLKADLYPVDDDEDLAELDIDYRMSPLFGKVEPTHSHPHKHGDPPIPQPPGTRPPDAHLAKQIWVNEEDSLLISMVHTKVSYNWLLISETLNSFRLGVGDKKSDWDCYIRYAALLNDAQKDPSTNGDLTAVKSKAKMDASKKWGRKLGLFEQIIVKSRARADRAPKKLEQFQKRVNLASHDTHKQAQDNAGVNLGAEPLGPGELG